jgi:hypothetical protein
MVTRGRDNGPRWKEKESHDRFLNNSVIFIGEGEDRGLAHT